ncbi:MAG: WD40 repeat domain-containing protein [Blastocatellia bacterium]
MRRLSRTIAALISILLVSVPVWAQIASTQTVRLARAFPPHTKRIVEILLSPDGSRIAARSADRTLRITDSKTGEAQVTITGLGRSESLHQWSPSGQSLVTTDHSTKVVQLWDVKTGKRIGAYGPHRNDFKELHWKEDGRTPSNMLTDGDDKEGIELWDLESNKMIAKLRQWELKPHETTSFCESFFSTKEWVTAWSYGAFADKGRRVVTSNDPYPSQLWDTATGKLIAKLYLPDEIPKPSRFDPLPQISPDTRLIAARSPAGIRLWDAATGQLIHTLAESAQYAFSPDGKTIITTWRGKPRSSSDELTGELKFWDVASGQLQFKIERAFKSAWRLSLAPDHRRLLVFGFRRNKMRLIDLDQRKPLAELPVNGAYDSLFGDDGCEPVVFSPEGKILLTQSKGDIKLWDAGTGKLIVDLNEARMPVVFSPDGQFLITASKDRKSVMLWEIIDQ